MKGTKRTMALAMTMALTLGLSTVAGADEHRGRGYRDGSRHTQAVPRHMDNRHRAHPRSDKRHVYRRHDRHGPHLYGRSYRDRDWRHREYRRAHKRARKHARRHGWSHWRDDRRPARRHGYREPVYRLDHGYRQDSLTFWLDGIGFTITEREYR